MGKVKAHPHIPETILHIAGEGSIPGVNALSKLSSNGSPLGPSPKAIKVFNVSRSAQAAAITALQDTEHTIRAQRHNNKRVQRLSDELKRSGLKITSSKGNFLLMHFDDSVESQAVHHYLRQQGIIVHTVAGYGLPRCLRISIGSEHENRKVIEILKMFLKNYPAI